MSSFLAAQGFVTFPDTPDWMHRFQIKSGTSARVYMIGRHRATGVWVCSCMGFRSGSHCKHLQSAWHVLTAVDKLDGALGGARSRRDVDFGLPWLPLPDDDMFYAWHPNVAVGQRPFTSDSYPQYDQAEGRGSRAEWAKIAEVLLTKFGVHPEDYGTYAKQDDRHARTKSNSNRTGSRAKYKESSSMPPRRDPLIEVLGIGAIPTTLAEFKTAARKRIMDTHPDRGGSAEAFRTVYAAYEKLALRIFGVKV